MNRIGYVCLLLFAAVACKREDDPRLADLTARLDKLEKRVDVVEKRPAAASRPAPKRADPNVVYNLPVDDNDSIKGPKAAKVTIVTGSEFACPWCALAHPAIADVAKKYPDSVRVVSKQYIIHPDVATLPAYGLCAAQKQGKAPQYEEKLWAKAWKIEDGRPRLDAAQLKQESLEALVAEIGADLAKWKSDLSSQGCKDWVAKQMTDLNKIGVNGTPAFFINGRPYVGARTVEGFSAVIDEELKKADAALSSGVKAEDYYASLMKNAQKQL